MDVFEVVPAYDERTHVPFRVPRKDDDPIEFFIPRLQFLDEDVARTMKEKLQKLDVNVPQVDAAGEPVWKRKTDGTILTDDDGQNVPLMGPPQRTVLERTRAVAETMLSCVTEPDAYEKLQKLTVGELDQILGHWTKVSEKPLEGANLGESSASSTS